MTDTCPRLDGQDKSVTKGRRDGSACFQESLEVDLGGFLKAQDRLATVTTMGMTPGQQPRFRDPHTVRVATHLNLGKRDNHSELRIYELRDWVNRAVAAGSPRFRDRGADRGPRSHRAALHVPQPARHVPRPRVFVVKRPVPLVSPGRRAAGRSGVHARKSGRFHPAKTAPKPRFHPFSVKITSRNPTRSALVKTSPVVQSNLRIQRHERATGIQPME